MPCNRKHTHATRIRLHSQSVWKISGMSWMKKLRFLLFHLENVFMLYDTATCMLCKCTHTHTFWYIGCYTARVYWCTRLRLTIVNWMINILISLDSHFLSMNTAHLCSAENLNNLWNWLLQIHIRIKFSLSRVEGNNSEWWEKKKFNETHIDVTMLKKRKIHKEIERTNREESEQMSMHGSEEKI